MRRLAPISLRVRSDAAMRRARGTLLRVSEDELLRRRIKWLATKSIISIRELVAVAGPELERISPSDHRRWRAECDRIEAFLQKIKVRGV